MEGSPELLSIVDLHQHGTSPSETILYILHSEVVYRRAQYEYVIRLDDNVSLACLRRNTILISVDCLLWLASSDVPAVTRMCSGKLYVSLCYGFQAGPPRSLYFYF